MRAMQKRLFTAWIVLCGAATLTAASALAQDDASGFVSPGMPPARVVISRIGVKADVVPVGLSDDGQMQVPKNPDQVGWYELGPGIAPEGNMILAGHVDWGGRLRVFGFLKQLTPGDEVLIWDHDGNEHRFIVQWTRLIPADDPPWDEIFGQGSDTEITLLTCGGPFDRQRHEYLERVVVRAKLESSAESQKPAPSSGS